MIDYFRHGGTQLFKKDMEGLCDGDGLICRKAILKYRHGSLTMGELFDAHSASVC